MCARSAAREPFWREDGASRKLCGAASRASAWVGFSHSSLCSAVCQQFSSSPGHIRICRACSPCSPVVCSRAADGAPFQPGQGLLLAPATPDGLAHLRRTPPSPLMSPALQLPRQLLQVLLLDGLRGMREPGVGAGAGERAQRRDSSCQRMAAGLAASWTSSKRAGPGRRHIHLPALQRLLSV